VRSLSRLLKASLGLGLALAACGGTATVSVAPSASPAASKPAASAVASVAASKPAASAAASAKPAASAAAKPTPTTLPAIAANTTEVTLTKVAIPPAAGKTLSADIMEEDQATNRLYVADRTTGGIDVFDTSSNPAKYITTAKTKGAPNGVAVAKNVNKLIVGEGDNAAAADSPGQSTAGIIDITDPANPKVLAELSLGGKKRTDEVDYDPNTKRALAANSDDQFATVIDMVNNTVLKKIALPGGGLEQPRYNPVDKFMYLNGSDDNVMYQIDMNAMAETKKYDIGQPCGPTGLTVNPTTDMGVVACGSQKQPQQLVWWDFKAAKSVKTLDQAGACDGAMYDAKANKFFVLAPTSTAAA
jgi:hypothetical protein